MTLWNTKPSTFRDPQRPQNYIIVDGHHSWYNVPICAPLPSAGTITVAPCISHSKDLDSAGPLDGDLPLRCKSAIEFRVCDNGQNLSSDSFLMQPTILPLLPSAPGPLSKPKTSVMLESPPRQLTLPMSPPLDKFPSETPQSGKVTAPTSRMWAQRCYGVDLEAPVE